MSRYDKYDSFSQKAQVKVYCRHCKRHVTECPHIGSDTKMLTDWMPKEDE